jgi:ABC-type branched-subunit amino acid transport system substrate-binding protein
MLVALSAIVRAAEPASRPYDDFRGRGAGFEGPGREETAPLPEGGIKIGFAGPEKTWEGREFGVGAELAIEDASRANGIGGVGFKAVFRPDDGPWGMVSKHLVALAYEDEVWTIVGGLDGGRAHVAELLSAKAWVPVLAAVAGDYTIDYANVPWVFRVAPSDAAQAKALVRELRRRGIGRPGLAVEAERDARVARQRLAEAARSERVVWAIECEFEVGKTEGPVGRLAAGDIEGLVVWGRHDSSWALIEGLRAAGNRVPVFAAGALASPGIEARSEVLGDVTVASPFDFTADSPLLRDFRDRYERRTGVPPSPVAALSYDATRLACDAISRAGLSRARIRDEIAKAKHAGLTGEIRFGALGGNPREPVLLRLDARRWVPLVDASAPAADR